MNNFKMWAHFYVKIIHLLNLRRKAPQFVIPFKKIMNKQILKVSNNNNNQKSK